MKVTLINHSDTRGGASVVTFRLMQALRRAGVDARMLVGTKHTDSPYVAEAAPAWRLRLPFIAEHLRILAHNGLNRRDMFRISIATDGLPLSRHPWVADADAVILNWVNQGMLSLSEISRIATLKPTLWTLHDMWPFTSICHHAANCTLFRSHCHDCPVLGSKAAPHDLSYRTFDRKLRAYTSAPPITLVAVSSWLAAQARTSALTSAASMPVAHIPNALDIDALSRPAERSRADLGLPATGPLILFCAARIDDHAKDLPLAIEALNIAAEAHPDAKAIMLGDCRDPHALDSLRMPCVHLPATADHSLIHDVMAHSAIVLSTSPFESLPTVLIEAQAAGAIPVGPVHDGRADIITHAVNGYASADRTPRAIADAISQALRAPVPHKALADAAARFSYASVAGQYISLIEKTIESHPSAHKSAIPHN